jgi:hypothetical protein
LVTFFGSVRRAAGYKGRTGSILILVIKPRNALMRNECKHMEFFVLILLYIRNIFFNNHLLISL